MKTARKVLLLVLCAALLVSASVMGTMAYLTSKDTVTNTFTVGKVGITLDETDVDLMGVKNGETRVKANNYKLLPGHKYTKDPVVHVQPKSEEAYVRLLVTISKKSYADDVLATTADGVILLENYVDKNAAWEHNAAGYKADANADTATYEFRYKTTVANDTDTVKDLPALFTTITMPDTLTNEQIAKLDGVTVTVVAQAIQAADFEAKGDKTAADVAWESFPVETQG